MSPQFETFPQICPIKVSRMAILLSSSIGTHIREQSIWLSIALASFYTLIIYQLQWAPARDLFLTSLKIFSLLGPCLWCAAPNKCLIAYCFLILLHFLCQNVYCFIIFSFGCSHLFWKKSSLSSTFVYFAVYWWQLRNLFSTHNIFLLWIPTYY